MADKIEVPRKAGLLKVLTLRCVSALALSMLIGFGAPAFGQAETPVPEDDLAVDTSDDIDDDPTAVTSTGNASPTRPSTAARAQSTKPQSTPQKPARPQTPSSTATLTTSKSNRIENLDFKDAPIGDVIRAFSTLTGKNFIVDPGVKGTISILAPSSVTQEEAYQAFLSALAINGFTVVPSGKFLKVLPSKTAPRDSIGTFITRDAPNTDQIVTRIIKLEHLPVNTITKYLRGLVSKDGDMIGYDPTNSLILTDYGSNIRRLDRIIQELDKPGFEERMTVIPIRYAKAKDLASMIEKLTGQDQRSRSPFPGGGVGMFPPRGLASNEKTGAGNLSLVVPDERTNSLVVLGDANGIAKVRVLVEELDFNLDPSEGGGMFLYHLKHSVAEAVEKTLTNLISKASGAPPAGGGAPSATRPYAPPGSDALFGGDVKIAAEKATNSLIIMASKQDYAIVENLLKKIDVPRDQVYVEAIIMEVNSDKTRDWRMAGYGLDPKSGGIGRAGFSSPGALESLLNPTGDSGLVLGFGGGQTFGIEVAGKLIQIPSLLGFVNFLKSHADANILSTPQILAMDNEEATIEVGDQIPIGIERATNQAGIITEAPRMDKASIRLTITPYISADSGVVRMKVDQSVRQASEASVRAKGLKDIATIISDRSVKTSISVNDKQTIVLGGLIRDEESQTEAKVPFLGDIPVLGWLFKSSSTAKKKVNLLIFLTPKIIRSSADNRELLGRKLQDRKEWMDANGLTADPHSGTFDRMLEAEVPVSTETTLPAPTPEPAPTHDEANVSGAIVPATSSPMPKVPEAVQETTEPASEP